MTLDAMGCQRTIAKQIKSQGANYVLAVKENQERLYKSKIKSQQMPAVKTVAENEMQMSNSKYA